MIKKLLSVFCLFSVALFVNAQVAQSYIPGTSLPDSNLKISRMADMLASVKNGEIAIPVRIDNVNSERLKNLYVTATINGKNVKVAVTPEMLKAAGDNSYYADIKVPTPEEAGEYNIEVAIDKINGNDIAGSDKTSVRLVNVTREVVHKVVFEEFTSLGCAWCPRGLVGMERAREKYGENVILISAHYDDPMLCKQYNLVKPNSLPSSNIDRKLINIDPYFGTSNGKKAFGIGDDIQTRAEAVPVAEVNVEAVIDGDILTAKTDVKFLYTGNGNYALTYVLTEDGVFNENWTQGNNYYQIKGQGFLEENDPMFERWLNGGSGVKGYVYNDVAIDAKGIKMGLDNSVPSSFVAEESNLHEVEFNIAKLKKIQNRKNLNVCALLFDRSTGEIVNADYMSFEHETAIDGVISGDDVVETARYTADGRKINNPCKGLNIIKYSDGTVKKVMVK